jgi:hypothetical protein
VGAISGAGFDEVFRAEGVNVVQTLFRSPQPKCRPNASGGPHEPNSWSEPALIRWKVSGFSAADRA